MESHEDDDDEAIHRKWSKSPDFEFCVLHRSPQCAAGNGKCSIINTKTGEVWDVPEDPHGDVEFEIFKCPDSGNAFIYLDAASSDSTWVADVMKFEVGLVDSVEYVRSKVAVGEETKHVFGLLQSLLQMHRHKIWNAKVGSSQKDIKIEYNYSS